MRTYIAETLSIVLGVSGLLLFIVAYLICVLFIQSGFWFNELRTQHAK